MIKKKDTNKVIVIGLDGGTFDVLNPMIERGIMPNLASLIKEGVHGDTDTYVTGMGQGWASFMTGKDPTKHGVFYWALPKGVTSDYIKDKTIWDILSGYGKKVGIINVPYTYPPKPVNGFLISGLGSGLLPQKNITFTYPEGLYDEIVSEVGEYERGWIASEFQGAEEFLRNIIRVTELRVKTAMHLMKKHDPDFFMIVFRGMDGIQHNLWNYIDFSNPISKEDSVVTNLIQDYYKLVDNYIELIASQNDEKNIFIISDHGFGPSKAIVLLNEFLAQKGYLIKNRGMKSHIKLGVLVTAKSVLGPYYKKFMMNQFFNKLDNFRTKKLKISRSEFVIDWTKTVAFLDSAFGISINLKGRNPQGIVEPGKDYEILREEIIGELSRLKYPQSGEKVFKKVYNKEALNLKRAFDIAPDILFECEEYFQADPDIDLKDENPGIFKSFGKERFKFGTGIHRKNGIFVAKGKNIKNNFKINEVKIINIVPTILYMMGLPVPQDVDGRILPEIFKSQ